MIVNYNSRDIILQVYGNHSDDIQIESAIFVDDGSDIGDDLVTKILDRFADEIYLEWFDNQILGAENVQSW